jgi:aerobic-type carbon monoxide dehydrogenase small subunit (CoxS/CutS family)
VTSTSDSGSASDSASGAQPAAVTVRITVNGQRHVLAVEPRRSLADVLRREVGCTGTQVGCDLGICGTCTVLVDGEPVRACLMLAAQADGTEIETVESLELAGKPSALQRAFKDKHALQCGFCIPGFLMLSTALLRQDPNPSRERIRDYLSANLCRCTGYAGIIAAVESVASPS